MDSIPLQTGPDSLTHQFICSCKNPNSQDEKNVDLRLDTFNKLKRESNLEAIQRSVKNMIGQALKCGQDGQLTQESQYLADIFVLIFYFRDHQCGPGYRDIAYWMFLELWTYFPQTSLKCLHLFTEYGGWMDILHILDLVQKKYSNVVNSVFRENPEYLQLKELEDKLLDLCVSQTKKDLQFVEDKEDLRQQIQTIKTQKDTLFSRIEPQIEEKQKCLDKINISYWGKWSPAENGKYHWIAIKLASRLYGHLPIYGEYGEILYPSLNELKDELKKNNSVENQKKYKVSLRNCLKKYRKERVKLNKELQTVETLMCTNNWESIIPQDIPRKCFQKYRNTFLNINHYQTNKLECTLNFRKFFESNKSSTKQSSGLGNLISPYLLYNIPVDSNIETKWTDIVSNLGSKEPFKNMILVSDFSIEISTHICQELLGLFLLFHEMIDISGKNIIYSKIHPHKFSLDCHCSLKEKISSLRESFLIGNTDFKEVIQFILGELKTSDTKIVIFSDNSFDLETWKKIDSLIFENQEFSSHSKIDILYWSSKKQMSISDYSFDNLEIQVMEGFNYHLLTYLIKSDFQNSGQQIIHSLLNSSRYHKIRDICFQSQEGKLANYKLKNDWITLS